MTASAAMLAAERIARRLDPEAWDRLAATNAKQYDIRRANSLKLAARVLITFAPMLAKNDERIREMAFQGPTADQQLAEAHNCTLAAEASLAAIMQSAEWVTQMPADWEGDPLSAIADAVGRAQRK